MIISEGKKERERVEHWDRKRHSKWERERERVERESKRERGGRERERDTETERETVRHRERERDRGGRERERERERKVERQRKIDDKSKQSKRAIHLILCSRYLSFIRQGPVTVTCRVWIARALVPNHKLRDLVIWADLKRPWNEMVVISHHQWSGWF